MGFEPGLFSGRPCDWSGCASSANPSVSFDHRVFLCHASRRTLDLTGRADGRQWADRLRERLNLAGGRPDNQRPHDDPKAVTHS